jgi:hypothetical protein
MHPRISLRLLHLHLRSQFRGIDASLTGRRQLPRSRIFRFVRIGSRTARGAPFHTRCPSITPGDSRLPPFRALAEHFVDAVRAASACQPDFAAGARVQRLVADIEAPTHIGHAARRIVL